MLDVTEARQALKRVVNESVSYNCGPIQRAKVLAAADVLGDARALAGHVEVCEKCVVIAGGEEILRRRYCPIARRLIDGNDEGSN